MSNMTVLEKKKAIEAILSDEALFKTFLHQFLSKDVQYYANIQGSSDNAGLSFQAVVYTILIDTLSDEDKAILDLKEFNHEPFR